ncbi:hypothetical protein VPHK227_0051 [Vibrio phage K227]
MTRSIGRSRHGHSKCDRCHTLSTLMANSN